MGKTGKISAISKEFRNSQIQTLDSELNKKGMTRIPGTGVFRFPYKELSGLYRTGLDPDAVYIKRILDPTEKELEIKRVTELREKLELALGGVDLGPRSTFWNYALSQSQDDMAHVQPYKLQDGDNYFDLNIPFQELTFAWLRVHPTIASSMQAYQAGLFPAATQFYVHDAEIENAVMYKKKQIINKAVVKLDSMAPTRRTKVARLLGLPIADGTKEEVVYNLIDNVLKQTEFSEGAYKGLDPVKVFTQYADMKENVLHIKDLVAQAISHSIYRKQQSGRIYEGEFEVAITQEELVKHLADDLNQEDLLILEDKLKTKKLAAV
jgi:hypothetical protein